MLVLTFLKWYFLGFSGETSPTPKSGSNSSSHPQSPSSRVFTSPSSNRSLDISSSPSKSNRIPVMSPKQLKSPISSVYDSQIGSQEEIVERAKQVNEIFLLCR